MKLKKIASLMLAGIMAVSMLAGCSNGNSNSGNNNGGETNTATGIAKALNDGQAAANKANVAFTSDSVLDAALAEAVKRAGSNATAVNVLDKLSMTANIVPDTFNASDLIGYDASWTTASDMATHVESLCKDGKTVTYMTVAKLSSDGTPAVWSEDAAVKTVATNVDDEVAKLLDTTFVDGTNGTAKGHTYYDFSYTGKASMVSVARGDGNVDYYVAIVITQAAKAVKA